MRSRPALVLLALLVFGWLGMAATPASADHVRCGDILTADTTLDSDLECPFSPDLEGQAITIAADDVTLDLGGHSIVGPGVFSDTAGIVVTNFDRAVIRDGAVHGFDVQVVVRESRGTVVERVETGNVILWGDDNGVLKSDTAGIDVRGDRNRIAHNLITGPFNSQGSPERLQVQGGLDGGGLGRENVIAHNRILGVVPGHDEDSEGMSLFLSGGRVVHNTITAGNYWPPRPFQSTRGMTLVGQGALVKTNVATGHEDGFYIAGAFDVVGNTANNNFDDGIEVALPGTLLRKNVANDNGDLGIEAHPETVDGGGNRARGNGNPAQCIGVTCK